jgi:hypothetical protein
LWTTPCFIERILGWEDRGMTMKSIGFFFALAALAGCGSTPLRYVVAQGAVTVAAPKGYERDAGRPTIVLSSGKRTLELRKAAPAAFGANLDDRRCQRFLATLGATVVGKRVTLGAARFCRGWKKTEAGGEMLTVLADAETPWLLRCVFAAEDAIGAQTECDALIAKASRTSAASATPAMLAAAAKRADADDAKRSAAKKSAATKGAAKAAKSQKPELTLKVYVMSRCRFAARTLTSAISAIDTLGPKVGLELDYIVTAAKGRKVCNRLGTKSHRGFCALHGPPEVQGNIAQLCAAKIAPKREQWRRFVACSAADLLNIPSNWRRCAGLARIDALPMASCIGGDEGEKLLRASMARSAAARASGSPTIYLGANKYLGGRGKHDFMRAACAANKTLRGCSKLPEPVRVEAIVLNDKRCKKCKTSGLETNLRSRFFPKLVVRHVDYASAEGKRLYRQLQLEKLPVWLFSLQTKRAAKYPRIKRWMDPLGGYLKLRVPARWNPTAEICDNKKDDTGNGRVDCRDPTCKKRLVCRKNKRRRLDLFIMSMCPFANRALQSYKELREAFKRRPPRLRIHYIVDRAKKGRCRRHAAERGFCALHGPNEVKENIRQLCARRYYGRGDRYLDYVFCRTKNYRSTDWRKCAVGRISAKRIERCAEGKLGVRLLTQSMKEAMSLQITGSPTWLANNRHRFNGISATQIQKGYCQHNPKERGCAKKLSDDRSTTGKCGK